MSIRIVAVGKKHESWVSEGIERYEKRLKPPFTAAWELLPHSHLSGDQARQEESERILRRLKGDEYVIVLDERGTLLDSPALSRQLADTMSRSRSIVVVIGGAYGVTTDVHERADLVWSLSPLVFPHQLVRLVLVEQLYRAQEITKGGKYHHE